MDSLVQGGTLQPGLQPAAPIPADGAGSEASRPVCKCGAGPHRSNPQICAKGHALRGNQRARVHENERPEALDVVQVQSTTAIDVLDRQVARIQRRIEHREGRLRMALSASKRERMEKVQAADEAALVAALQMGDKLQKEGRTATTNR